MVFFYGQMILYVFAWCILTVAGQSKCDQLSRERQRDDREGELVQENVKIIRRIRIIVRDSFDVFIIYESDLLVQLARLGKIH